MGEQFQKRFTRVFKKFSTLTDERCYSHPFPFAGCNWHIIAYPNGYKNCQHLSLFLGIVNPESLPPGWRREVKFRLTLDNKVFYTYTKELDGQAWFDATSHSWGFKEFLPLFKLRSRDDGFLVGDKLVIFADLHLFPAVVLPEETVKVIEPQSCCNEGNQAADVMVVQKFENDASHEKIDYDESQEIPYVDDASSKPCLDDDDASEEGVDDDGVSEEGSDDGSEEGQDDDAAPTEDPGDEDIIENEHGDENASSLVSGVNEKRDASQRVEDGDMTCNKVASVSNVNGFQVLSSQVELVSHIFERHPDIALGFRPKNQEIRRVCMNELLSLIDMLCKSPEKLSEDDLSSADDTLADLADVGFKLDWLKIKLNEVSEKKKKENGSDGRLRIMEEQMQKLKLMFLDLETLLQKEKEEALAARAPLSFNDVVC